MDKPRLLDLFCGAGGAAMGYHRAGFEVIGVDVKPQKHYPFEFHQADALEFLAEHGREYDAIHASPPCQGYSATKTMFGRRDKDQYLKLIEPIRDALIQIGVPFVIENVVGAPLRSPIRLCGVMFGLKVYRHRLFESNVLLLQPLHPKHPERIPDPGRGVSPSGYVTVCGKGGRKGTIDQWRAAMSISWMSLQELAQAIPPAYTEYIGKQLMAYLNK